MICQFANDPGSLPAETRRDPIRQISMERLRVNAFFDGFLALSRDEQEEETKIDFAHYFEGDVLKLAEVHPTQHFTNRRRVFSDASLVKAL